MAGVHQRPGGLQIGNRRAATLPHQIKRQHIRPQAQKFAGTEHEEQVRKCKTPGLAADMGRSRKLPLRRDWESVKDQIMLEAVRAKFSQHDDLKAILLGTGDAKLVEHTERDSYWGDGGDGSGKNRLGRILMQVRDELRGQLGE